MLLKAQRLAAHSQAEMLRAGVRPVQTACAAKFHQVSTRFRGLCGIRHKGEMDQAGGCGQRMKGARMDLA
jgi:hypothetical protein